MEHIFILGSHPSLSLAELVAVLGDKTKYSWPQPEVVITSPDHRGGIKHQTILAHHSPPVIRGSEEGVHSDGATNLMNRLGGTIKIGLCLRRLPRQELKDLAAILAELLITSTDGRVEYGLSEYGDIGQATDKLGLSIKRLLKEEGRVCRFVTSRERTLSSVVVTTNKLTGPGIELLLVRDGNDIVVGRTLAVQPFQALSERDYGRPARDDASGMLPPKVARIMLNLARVGSEHTMLDPFCGSGTVLMEARLLGCTNLHGLDNSPKAISDSHTNLDWLDKKYDLPPGQVTLNVGDATDLKTIKPKSIDRIVTEPYLGPARGRVDQSAVRSDLEALYTAFLRAAARVLKPDGNLAMILPVRRDNGKLIMTSPDIRGWHLVPALPESLAKHKYTRLTHRNTLLYGRPNQRVWRELIVLAPAGSDTRRLA